MDPLLLLAGAGLLYWLWTRKTSSATGGEGSGEGDGRSIYEGLPPARTVSTLQAILPSEEASTIVREGLSSETESGSIPLVLDPWQYVSEGGTGLLEAFGIPGFPVSLPGSTMTGDDVLPGLPTPTAARGVPTVKLGPTVIINRDAAGISTPVPAGSRVTFSLTREGYMREGVLEGYYYGPETKLNSADAPVLVDRIAKMRDGGGEEPPLGKYIIPASKWDDMSDSLSRVRFEVLSPEEAGLKAIESPPTLVKGDWLTLIAKDNYGNVSVWLGIVQKPIDGGYEVSIVKHYRMLINNGGSAPPSPPKYYDEGLVTLKSTQLVNPKSIPAAS